MKQTPEELKAQARRFLKVRPSSGLPEHGRLEVVITLRNMTGEELMPPVSNQSTLLRPLSTDMREVHLNTLHRTMRVATELAAKLYSEEFKRHEVKTKKEKPERTPNSVVVPMFPDQPAPEVEAMLNLSKSKVRAEDELKPADEPA